MLFDAEQKYLNKKKREVIVDQSRKQKEYLDWLYRQKTLLAEECPECEYEEKQQRRYDAFDASLNSRDPLKDTMEKYMQEALHLKDLGVELPHVPR